MSHTLGTFETILLAEMRVGLPPLFYTRLLDIADDWAFVLKLHSFFEGTLTKLLQEKLALRTNHHETMTPRDSFVSRVHLAERIGVMEPDYRGFLLGLNRLRNDLTHNIRFISFDPQRYVDGLSDTDFRRTATTLCAGFKNVSMGEFVAILENPKDNPPASAADNEFGSHFRNSLQRQHKASHPRKIGTVREFFWNHAPKASMWQAGVWTLDLLSLHFIFEGVWSADPEEVRRDPRLAAKIQDLRLDPAVLAYKRKVDGLWNDQKT